MMASRMRTEEGIITAKQRGILRGSVAIWAPLAFLQQAVHVVISGAALAPVDQTSGFDPRGAGDAEGRVPGGIEPVVALAGARSGGGGGRWHRCILL
jgi:hypothetical protein